MLIHNSHVPYDIIVHTERSLGEHTIIGGEEAWSLAISCLSIGFAVLCRVNRLRPSQAHTRRLVSSHSSSRSYHSLLQTMAVERMVRISSCRRVLMNINQEHISRLHPAKATLDKQKHQRHRPVDTKAQRPSIRRNTHAVKSDEERGNRDLAPSTVTWRGNRRAACLSPSP